MTESNNILSLKADTIRKLDTVAAEYQLTSADATPFQKTFLLAEALGSMRELLTPEIMKPIMALMNTDLGFRTDRDPHQNDTKTGKPHIPYSVDVVKDIVVEGTLRGYFVVNNEFNIIAGRFYAAKNGIRRKVTRWPSLTDFKDVYQVPRIVGEKGAVVMCSATWKINGTADSIEREIPVRVNASMGTDAILGKAERKLLKSVLDRISGEITPDGEAGDEPTGGEAAAAAKAKTVVGKPATSPKPDIKASAQEGSPHESVTTTKPAATGHNPSTSVPQAEGEMSDEEKASITRQEALDTPAEEYGDLEAKLRAVMAIDKMEDTELGQALTALQIKIPRDFKGAGSLNDKTISDIMQAKVWQNIRSFVINKRAEAADFPSK